jgi:DNA recombination protein RmuC
VSSGPFPVPALALVVVVALALALAGLVTVVLTVRSSSARARELARQDAERQVERGDLLLAELAAARGASESLDRRFDELRRAVDLRVSGVEQRLADGQKSVTDHLGASGRLLEDVGKKIGRLFEASQKIEKLAGEVTRLEDLLKPPKLRGTLGEAFLEQALRQALPPRCWKMQHRFSDNVVVDAVITVGERLVPVDSKFPLENFRRSREAPDEAGRRQALRDFATDVRRHVEAIRTRYIRPDDGTYDFALMYVPAEAVYCEIAGEGEEKSLADFAVERRVVPVSPRLLYAYLATVAMGLRGLELQQSAQEVQARLADLSRLWERAMDPFQKMGTHLRNASRNYDEASTALDRFGGRLGAVAENAAESLDEDRPLAVTAPSLFPPG